MNTSLLKKIVAVIKSQWVIEQSLSIVEQLLVIVKKFGKQISQPSISQFIKKEYPDAYDLYVLLWVSRCTVKNCLLLRKYLREAMGERFLIAQSSHSSIESSLKDMNNNILVEISWDITNPLLTVQSPTKTYRRSLYDDLIKIA